MKAEEITATISRLSDLPLAERECAVWMWLGFCEARMESNPRMSGQAMFAALGDQVTKFERVVKARTTS